jgi:WD40-like Beta Propeller Repeat
VGGVQPAHNHPGTVRAVQDPDQRRLDKDPDGQWVTFQRQFTDSTAFDLYKIRADGSDNFSATLVYDPGSPGGVVQNAGNPAYSPDGKVLVLAKGAHKVPNAMFTHTLDPELSTPKAIGYYPDWPNSYGAYDPFLMPLYSPDGTKLAFRGLDDQIWATRRNMSLPPRITQIGAQTLPDSAATVTLLASSGIPVSYTMLATDGEGDPITCGAHLRTWWMGFNPLNCQLTLQPPLSAVGKTFHIVLWVTTPSGGTDRVVGVIPVQSGSSPGAAASFVGEGQVGSTSLGDGYAIPAVGFSGGMTRAQVFDLLGRHVATIRGPGGIQLTWDGRDARGARVTPGVYLYRSSSGPERRQGKIVVVR